MGIDCLPGWISVAVLCQLSALASAGSFDIFHNAYDYHSTSPSCYGLHQGLEDYVACFLAEYIGIFVAYLVVFTLGSFPYVKVFFWWNMGLCCVAWAGALGSLLAHLMDQLDFITLLWIDNATSMVWVLWVLWKQWTTMQKVRSHGENKKLNVLKQNGFWSRIP